MEEIKADLRSLRADVQDVKHTLKDNTLTLMQNTAQLEIHIKGVRDLDARVKPLEENAIFTRKLASLFIKSVGVGAGIAAIARLFL